MNAWSVVGAESIPKLNAWFGLYQIELVGYQGHVIPVVIAVWFMSMLEKKLHKIVPEMIDLFVTPLVTVLVTGYLTLTIFGPVFSGGKRCIGRRSVADYASLWNRCGTVRRCLCADGCSGCTSYV